MRRTKSDRLRVSIVLALFLVGINTSVLPITVSGQSDQDEDQGARHLCPVEAIRNGVCDPNPNKNKSSSPGRSQKQPQYKRVAKQTNTTAKCNVRVQHTLTVKVQTTCKPVPLPSKREDLPLTSQRVGITIWKVSPARRNYEGARILSHPGESRPRIEYQAARVEGDPILAYGDMIRLSIESPRDGYLYVFDRELYDDGSLSAAYMIFPTTRLRDGNNRIKANRPVELPSLTDNPIFFEAKKVGVDPEKRLVGEILSIAITDKPISSLNDFGGDVSQVPALVMESVERLYAGRAEVFELEQGLGQPYSTAEREAANNDGSRLLTYRDPVPQTFYLVEDKRNGGLLVSVALAYKNPERVSHVVPNILSGLRAKTDKKLRAPKD